jgi:predicted acylesterase/phospholipase RssA
MKPDFEISRERFLALAAAVSAALAPATAAAQPDATALPTATPQPPLTLNLPKRLKRSLVLSGGGALGAYEAGVIQSLVTAAGVGEGQPLPQYGIVAGTSIGALNSYLVATAQWSKLHDLWLSIAQQNVIRLKPEFAKMTDPASGIGTRIGKAIGLALGLFNNVQGVLDGQYLQQWLTSYFDLSRPVVTPFIWASTNLNLEGPEYFYLLPPGFSQEKLEFALQAMQRAVGPFVPLREVPLSTLIEHLRASAAVPLAFDPVTLAGPDDKPAPYVDGGVTANTPIAVARAVSSAVDAVLLNPVPKAAVYKSALDISMGTFNTMQRRMMEDALHLAYVQTLVLKTLKDGPKTLAADYARRANLDVAELEAYADLLSDTEFHILRPKADLPLSLFGFDDAKGIQETYQTGVADGQVGFVPFHYSVAG